MPRPAFDRLGLLTGGFGRRLGKAPDLRIAAFSPSHTTAAALALFVVFLWATSWVLIKFGLQEIRPLTFAGLRYGLAALALLGAVLSSRRATALRSIPRSGWRKLALLGILLYAVTQGAVFLALSALPAVTVNLVWSFSAIVVAVMGIIWLAEPPTPLQWTGVALAAGGAAILVSIGLATEGVPAIGAQGWAIILWLAIVNTALAFTLWNHTLRTLTAVESSVINATMLIWIPILAWLFLGETLTQKAVAGLILAGAGTVLVQLRRPARPLFPGRMGSGSANVEGHGRPPPK